MKRLNNYITEKLRINKNIGKVNFFDLSENELIAKMIDTVETYNKKNGKHYITDFHYNKSIDRWVGELGSGISFSAYTCAELYKYVIWKFGTKEEYDEIKDWTYNEKNKEWEKKK